MTRPGTRSDATLPAGSAPTPAASRHGGGGGRKSSRHLSRAALKPVLFTLLALPLLALIGGLFTDGLGANPVETITHVSGEWALRLLLLALACTPIRKLTGITWVMSVRRMLGLYAFFYACVHLLTYSALDAGFDLDYIIEDVLKRQYITIGFAAFLTLLPLAATSTNAMIKRLGARRWRALHRLAYVATAAALLHFLWLVKADLREPLVHIGIFAVLMGLRIPAVGRLLRRRTRL
jgi:sulfoxide reductase heme-binding subunit YedZ